MYTIKEAAARTGIPVGLLRQWERRYGVVTPQRSTSGYRRYDEQALAQLAFVKKAQGLGFSLDDIKRILDLGRAGRAPCSTVLELTQQHICELDARIERLQRLRRFFLPNNRR